jgi:sortase (surface protein transpeptidase)
MVEKQRYGLDSTEMRSRVRGYAPRPISDIKPRTAPTVSAQQMPRTQTQTQQSQNHVAQSQLKGTLPLSNPVNAHKSLASKSNKFSFTMRRAQTYSLVAAAFVMIAAGGFLSYQGYKGNQQVAVQAKALAESATNSEDGKPANTSGYDETTPPANLTTYTVAADMPRFVSIPDVGVYARVKRVGTLNDNSIEAPKNVFDVGWYDGSSKPGEPGVMFLDGHVSGPTKGGIFANLKRVAIGNTITIERGDAKKLKYKVVAKELFDADKVDMAKVLRPYDSTKQGLNIMTCNGKFDAKTQTFDKRIVVYAVAE